MSEAQRKTSESRGHDGRKSVLQEFVGIEVAVVAPRDDHSSLLMRQLQRLKVRARHIWLMREDVPSDADVVYCEYSADLARRLPWVPGNAPVALVVIIPSSDAVDADALAHATPHAILPRPFTENAVLSSLVLARSQFRYEGRLRSKIERLDENLRAMRTVERAKAILMATRHIPEDEAYGFIRRQAMDRRVSTSAVASAIVDSFELLGYGQQH